MQVGLGQGSDDDFKALWVIITREHLHGAHQRNRHSWDPATGAEPDSSVIAFAKPKQIHDPAARVQQNHASIQYYPCPIMRQVNQPLLASIGQRLDSFLQTRWQVSIALELFF